MWTKKKEYKPFKYPVYCKDTDETVIDYGEYLRSKHWLRMKRMIHAKYNNECQMCHKKLKGRERNVHHLTYERIGNELPEDVTLLCRECHQKVHGIEKPKKKKRKARKPSKLTRLIQSLTPQQKKEAYQMLKERFANGD